MRICKPLVCGDFDPHPHAHRTKIVMCGARTRTPFFAPARAHFFAKKFSKKIFFFNFLVLKNQFFTKNECVRMCGAHPHPRGVHACTRTHIFENFSAPICTKIATPARVRVRPHAHTLKVCGFDS